MLGSGLIHIFQLQCSKFDIPFKLDDENDISMKKLGEAEFIIINNM